MLLAMDVGNTNTVFAVFREENLLGHWRIATDPRRTGDEYAVMLSQLLQLDQLHFNEITDAIISTVVPQTLFALKSVCRKYIDCDPLVVGDLNINLGIAIKVDRPSEVGADRLVNAVAVKQCYHADTIVLDFGTATTFDVVSREGNYCGGVIAPGINLSLDALRSAAAKLPEIAITNPVQVIGTSTVTAMQSGIYWGYVGLIEGIISRIKTEYGKSMVTVATGGLASLFMKATQMIDHHVPDLTIQGLRLIYEMNHET